MCCICSNIEVVDLLLSAGTDFNLADTQGRTPIHYAAANVHFPCVLSLVTTGANINMADQRGCTPLHYAAAADSDAKWEKWNIINHPK